MLPVQLVAVACMGVVYNWFITHPYVAKKVVPAKRLLISASKQAARRVRELLDSVSRLRLQNLDPWQPAPSPPATLTTAPSVHALDVALPSPPPPPSIPRLKFAPSPPLSPSTPLLDFPFSSRSLVPVSQKRFRAPLLSAVPQPRCLAIERNVTSHSQQCLMVDRLSPHAISTVPSSWSVHVRVEYSPLLGALVVVCVVVLPCLVAIYLVFVRLTRRIRWYSHRSLASTNKDQVADCEVIEIKTEGARRLEQISNCIPAECEVVPAATPAACYFTTQAELFAACAQSSSFTIDCSSLWDIPPVEAYRSLHFRVTPSVARCAIAQWVATLNMRLLFSMHPTPSHKMLERRIARTRAPPSSVDWSAFNIAQFFRCAERVDWTEVNVGKFFRYVEAMDVSTLNIGKFFRCAEAVDWLDVSVGAFFRCAERVDWTTIDVGKFFHRAEAVDSSDINIRAFFCYAERVDWTELNIGKFWRQAEAVDVCTLNIGKFFYCAEAVDWLYVDVGAFFRCAERVDWTTINVGKFFRCAEAVDWFDIDIRAFFRCAERVDWTSINVGKFFQCAEAVDCSVVNIGKFFHIAEAVDPSDIDIRAFFRCAELADWTTFDIPQFFRSAEAFDWTTVRISDIFKLRFAEAVDWSAFDVADFFLCAERADWTTFNIAEFFICVETVSETAPPSSSPEDALPDDATATPVVRLDIPEAADQSPPEAAIDLPTEPISDACDHIPVFPGSPLLSEEWYLRKKRPAQKISKQMIVPTRPPKEASNGQSSRARLTLRMQLGEAVVLALADMAREPESDEDRIDEVDNEREDEDMGKNEQKTNDKTGNDVLREWNVEGKETSLEAHVEDKTNDAAQHHPPPGPTLDMTTEPHPPSYATVATTSINANADQNAQTENKPNRKPRRRGGMSARVAKKKALEQQQQRDESASDQYAARRHDILSGEVTHRISGAWLIPEASPDIWARTYPPHVAQSYPSPPSGTKPNKKSDALRQRRHGRVKPFLGKVQYPTRPVIVLGHDMRYASDVRAQCSEERRARSTVMDKRRERCKESEYIDHLLVPLKPKIGDVSPELMAIVAEYEEAEAAKAAAAADPSQVGPPPSPAVRPENAGQHTTAQPTASSSRTPAENQTPNLQSGALQSPTTPTTGIPHTESPDSSGTAHFHEDTATAPFAHDGSTSPQAQSVFVSPFSATATPTTVVPVLTSSADFADGRPSLVTDLSPTSLTASLFTPGCTSSQDTASSTSTMTETSPLLDSPDDSTTPATTTSFALPSTDM